MQLAETITTSETTYDFKTEPFFGVVKAIPQWATKQIEAAVKDFIETSHLPASIDKAGLYYKTLESIASCTYMNGSGDFWLATYNGSVVVYGLAFVSNDIDGKLVYHIPHMWVSKEFRGNPIVKKWWEQIRQRAKDLFCKHLVITSTRSARAYERFLGNGMKQYATLLKEEI